MGSGMFAGVFEAIFVFGIIIGLIVCVCVAVPVYYYGKHKGKEAVYQECIDKNLLKIEYSPKDGAKLMIWKESK